jgi:hypothetical protein
LACLVCGAAGISVADYPVLGEIALRTKNEAGVCAEIIATPLVDAEGLMTELAGVTRDIRERRVYETELHQAREAAEIASRAILSATAELQIDRRGTLPRRRSGHVKLRRGRPPAE